MTAPLRSSPFNADAGSRLPVDPLQVKLASVKLSAWYRTTKAVDSVDLSIIKDRVTAIIGPSGCGKSTFVRCLNRIHEVARGTRVEGSVLLDGNDIYASDVAPVAVRRRVGMITSRPNPFPTMTVADNVLAGRRIAGDTVVSPDAIIEQRLRQVGLWDEVKDRLNRLPTELSGGQQQLLCLARAIAVEPEVLILDEPCAVLDPKGTARIEELVHELRGRFTVVIVTHSMQQAARVADYTAFFFLGRLVEYGETDVVFTRPREERTEEYITGRFG